MGEWLRLKCEIFIRKVAIDRMVHTCFGEFCAVTGSWDCPNRYDREEADRRTPEEIETARRPVKLSLEIQAKEFKETLLAMRKDSLYHHPQEVKMSDLNKDIKAWVDDYAKVPAGEERSLLERARLILGSLSYPVIAEEIPLEKLKEIKELYENQYQEISSELEISFIENHALQDLLFYSFRYCLGRMTYAVSDCVNLLIKYWWLLSRPTQKLIQREIREAIKRNGAGMDCDIDQWNRVLKLEVRAE